MFKKTRFKIINYIYRHLPKKGFKRVKVKVGLTKLRGLKVLNKGKNNCIEIGDHIAFRDCLIYFIGSNNTIKINNSATINSAYICAEGENNIIYIGRNTKFLGACSIAALEGTKIKIGDECLFSSNIMIRTGDSHSIVDINGNRINIAKNIEIGSHVWFCANVLVLKGTTILSNSVVAASTVLCKSYNKSGVVIAGVPGKIVKENINWNF